MKKVASLWVLALSLFIVGCGDSHESIAQEMVGATNDIAAVLEGITDEASAKAAESKLKAIGERMKEIETRAKALGEPDADQMKSMKESMAKDMTAAQTRMQAAMMKLITKPELMQHVGRAMDAVGAMD